MGTGKGSRTARLCVKNTRLDLVSKYGDKIDINKVELGSLSSDVAAQVQTVDPVLFDRLLHLQKPLVLAEMTTAYTIMFSFCAIAYIIAWVVMKSLVPRMKAISM
jgi:ACS family hexuronate transporter-like MFS transporter